MFVDGKSIKWELDGRRLTADELLAAAVWAKADSWTNWEYVDFSTEELVDRIWKEAHPTPDEFDADGDIPELICSGIRGSLSSAGCYYCGANRGMVEAMHTDHMQPQAFGGSDRAANKVQACQTCNLRKSANGVGVFRDRMAEWYDAESSPTFFGELPKVRRVLGIETQTAKARHPNLKPAETRPLSRMGESQTSTEEAGAE